MILKVGWDLRMSISISIFHVLNSPHSQYQLTTITTLLYISRGFFNFAQQTLPLLLETATLTASSLLPPPPPPTLILTGATASLKGSPRLATFAAGKFAQRAMCQSLAREFGPRGVHVVHAIIDGIIDTPATAGMTVNGGVEDGRLNPDDVSCSISQRE
jgi:NAD(P)-dependent dehydrogenase (short-subunit alcohol dehydrogenase family)